MSGETRDRYGWRVYVKVGSGPTRLQREKRFPPDATSEVRKAWREETRVELRKLRPTTHGLGTLRADVDRYLLQVQAMPTYAQRQAHLEAWIDALGAHRLRLTIKPGDIRAVGSRVASTGVDASITLEMGSRGAEIRNGRLPHSDVPIAGREHDPRMVEPRRPNIRRPMSRGEGGRLRRHGYASDC